MKHLGTEGISDETKAKLMFEYILNDFIKE